MLKAQGIDPLEAMARVDSLTDAEAQKIADQIEELPAGGGFFVTFLIVVGVIVLILAITDAMGYTNVFTFVRLYQNQAQHQATPCAESMAADDCLGLGLRADCD
jgi:hypothetical protein